MARVAAVLQPTFLIAVFNLSFSCDRTIRPVSVGFTLIGKHS